MSVPGRSPREAVVRGASAQPDLRLVFPRSATADGLPDGGWWPRSRDPATELPMLIAAVTDRLDPVHRITLDATVWDGRPEIVMTVEGRGVQLDWFGARDAHTISLIGSCHSRLDLVMSPADIATIVALARLAIAAGSPHGRAFVRTGNPEPQHPTRHRSAMEPKKPPDGPDNEMEIVVTGRHTDAPGRYREHIVSRLARLERYSSHVVHFDVMIDHEKNPRRPRTSYRVEITGSGRGPTMRAEAHGPDFSAALELAVGKLEERLRRSHDRRLVHHGRHNPTSVASATAPLAGIRTTDPD
jgi:ribosomal subunit interface protein